MLDLPFTPTRSSSTICSPRVGQISNGNRSVEDNIRRIVDLSIDALPTMYSSEHGVFGFSRRRGSDGEIHLTGKSIRYSAIVLLGITYLPEDTQRQICNGLTAHEFYGQLHRQAYPIENLGDAALLAWAGSALHHPESEAAIVKTLDLLSLDKAYTTVEAAWVLSAMTSACGIMDLRTHSDDAYMRLMSMFSKKSGIFPHHTSGKKGPWYRAHVGCFADQVYPIQALARYYALSGNRAALDAANKCAEQICILQGEGGQWWWHYDARTGQVIEGYPVYSVHQDAMAPMALLDLREAGGDDHSDSIRRGIEWLLMAPEIKHSLIDDGQKVIWRKIGRHEPWKISRRLRAVSSSLTPSWHLPWMEHLFPSNKMDYECRPYHLGWVLHTWLGGRR